MIITSNCFLEARNAIKNSGSIGNIVKQLMPDAKLVKGQWWGLSPLREDKNPGSFTVRDTDGIFQDFATKDKGDLITLVARAWGKSLVDAAKLISLELGASGPMFLHRQAVVNTHPKPLRGAKPLREAVTKALAAPIDDPGPRFPRRLDDGFECAGMWCYQDIDGCQVLWISRYQAGDEKKYLPWHMTRNGWRIGDPPGLLPLYNLPLLAKREGTLVVLTEGEKAADAASRVFPDVVAVTSSHGARSVARTDWEPLRGRDVVIWRDFDLPGEAYATAVSQALRHAGARSVRNVSVPDHFPLGWDLADDPPLGADLSALLHSAQEVVK